MPQRCCSGICSPTRLEPKTAGPSYSCKCCKTSTALQQRQLRIPMAPGVDSLNVGVAAPRHCSKRKGFEGAYRALLLQRLFFRFFGWDPCATGCEGAWDTSNTETQVGVVLHTALAAPGHEKCSALWFCCWLQGFLGFKGLYILRICFFRDSMVCFTVKVVVVQLNAALCSGKRDLAFTCSSERPMPRSLQVFRGRWV